MESLMAPGLYNLYPGHCEMVTLIMGKFNPN